MKRTIFFVAGLGLALCAKASPNAAVHCGANEERVWVYDNLTTFDVGAHLKCGDSVTVLGAQKDYVRVRTASGYEGYVAAKALPAEDLAALTPPAAPAAISVPVATPVAVAPVAIIRTAPAPQPVAPAVPVVTAAKPAPAPPVVQVVAAPAPAVAPSPVWIAPPPPAPAPVARVALARPGVSAVSTPKPAPSAQTETTSLLIEPATTSISIEPTAAPAMVKASDVPRSATVRPAISEAPRRPAAFADEEEDMPEVEAPAKDDLSSCNVFFSAYGLTPGQLRWFAASRGKQFPGVCPAPSPAMVDYVVIFTHDNNFYTASMPEPVHTDKNGFSDWSPVTPVDDTLVPTAELDKSRHEYAWVFRYHRGTFNPANFSGKRQPQYAKTDHGSEKAAEDALQFMAQGGAGQ